MSSGRLLHLHLGMRFGINPEKGIWNRVEEFVAQFERLEARGPIPLFWNFPAAPLLEKQSQTTTNLVAVLRRRLRNGTDRIVPTGFSRAPHPLLLPEELRHELQWCYRNSWFPALKKLFDVQPEAILPVYPDLFSAGYPHDACHV